MAQKTITMEQLKQILQLQKAGVGIREISRRIGISRNTIKKYLATLNNSSEEIPDDKSLAVHAYNNEKIVSDTQRLQQLTLHFEYAQTELGKTGVTKQLLWKEYMEQYPGGYGYSQYCYHLNTFMNNRDFSMHLEHKSGDKMMIDFAGKKPYYVDISTGEMIYCEVFVAVLPFSGLIFCYAVYSQQTAGFVRCINAMLKFYGGVPATILCDNLRTAVKRTDRYEPQFTDICEQLCEHYQTTFSATRPYHPRDKAMAERAVNIVYKYVYAPLRNQVFNSIEALNKAMAQQLVLLNDKPYKDTPFSRRYFFEQQEKSFLKTLPAEPFSAKKTAMHTVQRNYHIRLSEDKCYYSVPYRQVGKKVKVLYDDRVVEIYFEHERIAVHVRNRMVKSYSTIKEHMPPDHRKMKKINGFNEDDLLAMAKRLGNHVLQAAELILQNNIYMEQNYKSCFGMIQLHKTYTAGRLDAACARALQGTKINYTMIKNILKRGLDKQTQLPFDNPPIPPHDNIRGKENYK
jgi:transposase